MELALEVLNQKLLWFWVLKDQKGTLFLAGSALGIFGWMEGGSVGSQWDCTACRADPFLWDVVILGVNFIV